jgi:hypothetical protein
MEGHTLIQHRYAFVPTVIQRDTIATGHLALIEFNTDSGKWLYYRIH